MVLSMIREEEEGETGDKERQAAARAKKWWRK
jgi:hypothetical protein